MTAQTKNPFTISFSRKPLEYISRREQTDQILQTFNGDPVTDQLFLIMGVRGSGKTVMLSDIANTLESDENWIVIRCTPTGDIVHALAAELYTGRVLNRITVDASLSIPFVGNVRISQNREETDLSKITRMLETMGKQGKRLLVTIDEVTNTPQMREFASVFQILIGKEMPVFFLGTGLYEKIMSLQNEENMTFLFRAPKIVLGPLDMGAVANSYRKTFHISTEESRDMAMLTKGYSFAFQALGYTCWNHQPVEDLKEILPDYDTLLASSSYSKMWIEMSGVDRKVCRGIAESESDSVKDIREKLGMNSSLFNVYRTRLKERGILNTSEYGKVAFALPRFAEFVRDTAMLYEL